MIIQPGNIIVFLVVMAFFLISRVLDQKDRKINKARKYIEKQAASLHALMDQRKKEIESLDETIRAKEASTREMLKRVESLLQEIDAHSDDLMKLQAQLTHYHKILKDLALLTEKAERRVQMIKQESREIEETETRLEQLQTQMLQTVREAETAKQDLEQVAQGALEEFREKTSKIAQEAAAVRAGQEAEIRQEPVGEPADTFSELEDEAEGVEEIPYEDVSYEDVAQEEEEQIIPEEPAVPEVEPVVPFAPERKKDIVRKYRDQGCNAAETARRMGITRGEVELLLEILRFAEDE